jgi:hypothetical protein
MTSPPAHGSVRLSGTSFDYTPDSSFQSTDAFAYVVVDDFGATSDPTWVTLIMENPTVTANPPSRSGGGGALSGLEIWMLAIGVCLRAIRRAKSLHVFEPCKSGSWHSVQVAITRYLP